jgi:putative phage-type endonuclease
MMASMAEQRSPDWFAARCGKVTASRVADLMAKTRTGWGASRANYKAQLVCERLTGCVEPSYSNAAMQWGTEKEPEARAAYCFRQDVDVMEVGFVDHPQVAMSGASPDGLIGEDGLLELKCPQSATHIETLLGQSVPAKYIYQIQWQIACTGRAWCDFMSFDPRLPASMQVFIQRVPRDDEFIAELEREVSAFLAEVEDTVSRLQATYERAAA